MAFPLLVSWVKSYAPAILAVVFLASCTVYEDKSRGGSAGNPDGEKGIPLFSDNAPSLESIAWDFQSGVEKSASGTLNPIFFDSDKSPLRTPGSRIWLNLFTGSMFHAMVDKVRKIPGRGYAVRGHIEGFAGGTFIVTTHGEALSAVIRLGKEGIFRVEYGKNGKHRVVQQNSFEPKEHEPPIPQGVDPLPPPPAVLERETAAQTTRTVAIMVVYTSAAATGAGGTSALNALIESAIEESNEAYANSGLDFQLALAHTAEISYTEANNMTTDLSRVTSTTDGYMDNVHTLRNTYLADVVTLVTETSGGSYAGLGYVMQSPGAGFASYSFNVVRRSYLAGYLVLPHEIGHNLGCQHDAANANSTGSYTYSYGWRFTGNDAVQYRTVMAYAPGIRIPYFSNPLKTYQGKNTGTSTANNAKTINMTAEIMAAFRGGNSAPSITLAVPGGRTAFGGPTNMVLSASVNDDLGVDSVIFFSGSNRLGLDIVYPFKMSWAAMPVGAYSLTAVAYDKGGLNTTSSTLSLTVGSSGLASPWNDAFLGLTGMPGAATESGGTYTLVGAGTDYAGKSDGGQFAYQSLPGEGKITARILSVENTDVNAKAGLMLRDTLATGGKMAFVGLSPSGEVKVLKRAARNYSLSTIYGSALALPYHLALIRKANTVGVFASPDGSNWSYLKHFSITLPGSVLVGFSATSSDTAEEQTATFDNLLVASGTANFPPQITFLGPLAGRTFDAGTSISLAASISDLNGSGDISSVKFYNGATLLNTDVSSPFAYTWAASSGGANLKGVVEDSGGISTTSPAHSVTVNASGIRTVNPSKDCQVRNGSFATTNYGTSKSLSVRYSSTSGQEIRSFLVFPITAVATVSDATLRLYGKLNAEGSVSVQVYAVADTAWKESGTGGLNWNTKPVLGSFLGAAAYTETANAWITVDVGAFVSGWKGVGAAYVCFGLTGASVTVPLASLVSSEAGVNSGRPELVLEP